MTIVMVILHKPCAAEGPVKPISQYVHNVCRTEDGLPQNSVQTTVQTRDGYLWMPNDFNAVEPNPKTDVQPPQQSLRILLAEDNAINQHLAVRLLEKLEHKIVVAQTGREALAKLQEQHFDLVLMDIQMPDMDGFTATATVRQQELHTNTRLPIIAMTAHAMKAIANGVWKPAWMDIFLNLSARPN